MRLKHGERSEVLRGDQFEGVTLPSELPFDRIRDVGIHLAKGSVHGGSGRHESTSPPTVVKDSTFRSASRWTASPSTLPWNASVARWSS